MDSWYSPWCRVVESQAFTQQASRLLGSIGRWDEIKEFIDQHLARNPKVGHHIERTKLYGISLLTTPALTLFYEVDDSESVIRLVELREL